MREYSNSICGNESNDSDSSSDITDITIIAGVFFDGTNNNKYNVDFWGNGPNIHPSDKEDYEKYRKLKDDTDAEHYASYRNSSKQILQNFGICMILQRYQIALSVRCQTKVHNCKCSYLL